MNKHLLLSFLYHAVQFIISWCLKFSPLIKRKFLPQILGWKLCSKTMDYEFIAALNHQFYKLREKLKKYNEFLYVDTDYEQIETPKNLSSLEMLFVRYELLFSYVQFIHHDATTNLGLVSVDYSNLIYFIRNLNQTLKENIDPDYIKKPKKGEEYLSEYFQQRYDYFFDSRFRMTLKGRNMYSPPIKSYLDLVYRHQHFDKFDFYNTCNGVYQLFQKGRI
jgi:hypothetical protein